MSTDAPPLTPPRATRRPESSAAATGSRVLRQRRRADWHVHLRADGHHPVPTASDLYLPTVERRRRTSALIGGFDALGVHQTVLGPTLTNLARLPHRTIHLHLHAAGDLPHALVAASIPTARLVVHLRGSSNAPLLTGSAATVTTRLLGGPSERLLLREAALVVTNGDRLAAMAHDAGARRILVVADAAMPAPADLPTEPMRPLPERAGRRIVSVGPLIPRRRSTALVDALATLPDDVQLVLIGTGSDRLAVDRAARRLRVADRVVVVPTASHATVAAHLAHADVVASASLAGDDLPELLLAMAAGRPVVATAVHGVAGHLMTGIDGFLVAPADTPALARAIARLLSDPALASDLGASARRRTQAFGWDVVAARVLDALPH